LEVDLPLGTALIIPPQIVDINTHGRRHWVVCLFASSGYGRRINTQPRILSNLYAALRDLSYQLQSLQVQALQTGSDQPLALYANRFCTGLFRVRWELVHRLIENVGLQLNVCFPYTGDTPPGGRLPDRW
jgi:ADP-ribose 1''-phosphate phosphatase